MLFELFEACCAPAKAKPARQPRRTKGAGGHGGGVQPFVPTLMRPLLSQSGYSVWRGKVGRSWPVFLTLEAAQARYDLLDDTAKASVGSAERLHHASVAAYRRMKSRNRRAVATTYDDCLAETLAEE